VTRNVPQFSVVVGAPAKIINTRNGDLSPEQKDALFRKILEDFSTYASEFLKIKNVFSIVKTGTRCIIELVKKMAVRPPDYHIIPYFQRTVEFLVKTTLSFPFKFHMPTRVNANG